MFSPGPQDIFKKQPKDPASCDFHYINEGIPHVFLVNDDLSTADLDHTNFCQT